MLIQIQPSNKIYNSDLQEPDIEMGLDFIKLHKSQQSQQSYLKNQEEKEKENMSIFSKILNFLRRSSF